MAMRRRRYVLLIALSGALLAAACGGGGDAGGEPPASTAAGTSPVPNADAFRGLASGWETDFSRGSVPAHEFQSGGPGKDGIPAIDKPKFVPVSEVDFLDAREPVLAFEWNGDARAYPVQILIWHEIVNDVVGGEPVVVTFCPLCNSSVVFKRTVVGTVYDFGVSGFLRNSDLVMYDRQTETWWQQITGEAVVGELTGAALEFLPSSTISFADFRAAHPEGKVLSRDTGFSRSYGRNPYAGYDSNDRPFLFSGDVDDRLDAVDRVVALEVGGEAVAYAFSRLEEHPAVNDVVGGEPVAIFYREGTVSPLDRSAINESADVGAGVAYSRQLDDRILTFESAGDRFRDVETGSSWDISGRAVNGPLAGEQLAAVVHGNHFWFAWAVFKPGTRVWAPS
jgi:hypothetical protein